MPTHEVPWSHISKWVYRSPARKPQCLKVLLQNWVEQFEDRTSQLQTLDALLLDFRLPSWVDPVGAVVLMTSVCLLVGAQFEGPLGLRAPGIEISWLYRLTSLLGLEFLAAPIMASEQALDAWLGFRRAQKDAGAPKIFLEYWEERTDLTAERLPWMVGHLSGRLARLHSKTPAIDALLIHLSVEELQINQSDLKALSRETGIPWMLCGGSALQNFHGPKIVSF